MESSKTFILGYCNSAAFENNEHKCKVLPVPGLQRAQAKVSYSFLHLRREFVEHFAYGFFEFLPIFFGLVIERIAGRSAPNQLALFAYGPFLIENSWSKTAE